MNETVRLAPLLALSAMLLTVTGCSSSTDGLRSCPLEPAITQLCVVETGTASVIERLSATNLEDARQNIDPDPERIDEQLSSIPIGRTESLTLAIGPAAGLVLIEIDIYPSTTDLSDSSRPIMSAECNPDGCTNWTRTGIQDGQAIEIPRDDLNYGNVVIVNAFTDSEEESGTVSWGLVLIPS